jgi:iron complex transport system substrate-binding protein
MESDRLFQGKGRGGAIGRLWLWLLCGCCMTAASAQGQEIVDLVGRRVQVPDDPRRIVTLAPGLTEMVYAIGQQWRLKGVSRVLIFIRIWKRSWL